MRPDGRSRWGPRRATLFLLVALSVACAPADQEATVTPAAGETPAAEPEAESPSQPAGDPGTGLAGTAWRLVKIMSMDDAVYTPENPDRYTLVFNPDGTAQVGADCNRATGSWVSESSGQVLFGPMAATRAACPPGSLHDRYLGQFEWVRSYVIENGHLFLATMADGSIIEFEPGDPG